MPRTKKTEKVVSTKTTAPKKNTTKTTKTTTSKKPTAAQRIEELEKKLEATEKSLKLLVTILHGNLKKGQPQGPEGLAKILAGAGLLS